MPGLYFAAKKLARPAKVLTGLALVGVQGALALVQVSLGIATLVLFVPISLAAAHQLGAVALLLAVLRAMHLTRANDPERRAI